MGEKYLPNIFTKDNDDTEMLKKALESKDLDPEIIPILEKFLSLPITPTQSCYGHIDQNKTPHLSYVEDDTQQNQENISIQKSLRSRLPELNNSINQRLGSEAVKIILEEDDHGGGPKEYTIQFKIIDRESFQKLKDVFLNIIWEEFAKYLDSLK